MALGCSSLTDDQLVELLLEACNELVTRDGYVVSAAQREIDLIAEKQKAARLSTAQKLKALEEAYTDAVVIVKTEFQRQLTKEVLELVRRDVQSGKLRMATPAEEGNLVRDAELAAKQRILQEIREKLIQEKYTLSIQICGSQVTVCFGVESFVSRCYDATRKGAEIVRELCKIVGADCP
jgi:hypothetical protein